MKSFFIAIVLIVYFLNCKAQSKVDFKTPVQIEGKSSTLERFQGRPMLLELFSAGCIVCFNKMPYMSELQQQFEGRLNVVLLGNDKVKLPLTFEKFKSKYKLKLIAAFDKSFYENFSPPSVPHYYWVDADGTIQGESTTELVKPANLEAFIKKDYSFLKTSTRREVFEGPDIIPINKDGWSYRSSISSGTLNFERQLPLRLAITSNNPKFRVVNGKLSQLFQYAYFGRISLLPDEPGFGEIWLQPIVDDDTALGRMLDADVSLGLEFNGYRSPYFLQTILRNEILTQFGLKGELEERMMSYWSLERNDTGSSFLKSKLPRKTESSYGGLSYHSASISQIIKIIYYKSNSKIPMIDETNITWLIDLDINAVMTDISEVKKALLEKGLILTLKKRPMQVLKVSQVKNAAAAFTLLQR